jgi:hypothetical protein
VIVALCLVITFILLLLFLRTVGNMLEQVSFFKWMIFLFTLTYFLRSIYSFLLRYYRTLGYFANLEM